MDVVLGSASWCRFASDLLLVDQVTVDHDHHGMGIGPELMAAVVDTVTENLMVRIPEHAERAFVREMPPFPYRHSTLLLSTWPAPVSPTLLPEDAAGVTVMPFRSEHMERVLRYDLDVFHCQREPLVERIVKGEKSISALAFNEEMELLGYGVIQEMNNNTGDVSLLLADDKVIAGNLLRALAQHSSAPKLLTLTSPAPPDDRSSCFATRMGFSVRQAYVCRFTRRELFVNYPRVFSFGAI
ncbi:uncharacterized protein LOC144124111 [Amblyomma americanum]